MPTQPRNPFKPAEQVSPKVKALLFGPPGVGKTYLSLTAPGKIATIDTEGGTAFYAKRIGKGGLNPFEVLPTKSYRDVQDAVTYLAANPTAYATLVIDPVTVIYETLQEAAQIKRAERRHDPEADLEMLDWQRIKRAYKALMTELVNLPIHVIVTAREKDDMVRKGNESEKVGVKPDAEKATSYYFDTVIHLVPKADGREAVVLKDRTGSHGLNARIVNPTFDKLFDAALKVSGDAPRAIPSDEAAARTDADTTMATPWSSARLKQAAQEAGLSATDVRQTVAEVAGDRPAETLAEDDWREAATKLGLESAAAAAAAAGDVQGELLGGELLGYPVFAARLGLADPKPVHNAIVRVAQGLHKDIPEIGSGKPIDEWPLLPGAWDALGDALELPRL